VAPLEEVMEKDEFELFVQHTEDLTLVTFQNEEILESTCIQGLERSLMAVVEDARHQNLLLDFSNVQFMSSAFLGVLVKVHKRVREKKGHLTFKNIAPSIHKVFAITQLTKVFDIS
jgi:anti-sigma B factor antagonist